MNKKDSVPHKENATRMNIQLKKKKKFQACRKQENMTLKEEKKNTYIYISTETNSEPAQMLALADNVVTQLL